MDAIERRVFTEAMRLVATPVSVVTTDGAGGRGGVTVSSLCTASADPPQMLVCIHLGGSMPDVIRTNGVFCINILAATQQHVADSFAGSIARWRDDRFACDEWITVLTGAPALTHGLLALDCRLVQEVTLATHAAFVGLVVAVRAGSGAPLLYANQAYGRLHDPTSVAAEDLRL